MAPKVIFLLALRLIVGGAFLYAGMVKALDAQDFMRDIQHYAILPSSDATILLALYLPWVEIFCGAGVIFRRFERGALVAIVGLMLVFTSALTSAWARGLDISCGCFGKSKASIQTNFPGLLARDLGLLAAAGTLLAAEWRRRELSTKRTS